MVSEMSTADFFVKRLETDDKWMNDAACRGLSDVFFPSPAERPQARERRESMAREVCNSCEVLTACKDFSSNHHEYGFWGGESEEQRHLAGFHLIAPIGIRANSR